MLIASFQMYPNDRRFSSSRKVGGFSSDAGVRERFRKRSLNFLRESRERFNYCTIPSPGDPVFIETMRDMAVAKLIVKTAFDLDSDDFAAIVDGKPFGALEQYTVRRAVREYGFDPQRVFFKCGADKAHESVKYADRVAYALLSLRYSDPGRKSWPFRSNKVVLSSILALPGRLGHSMRNSG